MACPNPLVFTEEAEFQIEGTQCAIPCLGTMVTKEDAEKFGIVQIVFGTLGLLGSLFLVLTWGIFPQKRKQHLTFWFSVCSLMNSLTVVISMSAFKLDVEGYICKDEISPRTQSDGLSLCAVLGAFLLFFGTGQCIWWALAAIDLFRKIVLQKRNTQREKVTQHILAWGICTTVLVSAVSLTLMGSQQNVPFCFLALSPGKLVLDEDEILIEWLVFYGIIFTVTLVGTFCMACVIVTIIRQLNKVKVLQEVTGLSPLRQYSMYRTPFVFVMLFVFVWVVIFTVRLDIAVELDTFEEQANSWILCLLANFDAGILDPANDPDADTSLLIDADDDQVGCGLRQPGGVSSEVLILLQTVIMGQGVASFIIFGMRRENFWLWSQFIRNKKMGVTGLLATTSKHTSDEYPTRSYTDNNNKTYVTNAADYSAAPSTFGRYGADRYDSQSESRSYTGQSSSYVSSPPNPRRNGPRRGTGSSYVSPRGNGSSYVRGGNNSQYGSPTGPRRY